MCKTYVLFYFLFYSCFVFKWVFLLWSISLFVSSKEILIDFFISSETPAHSFLKLPNFKLSEAGRHERSLCHTGESHTDKFICFDFKRHPRGKRKVNVWLFITVLTLNVVSGFSSLSLLTAPSRFSAPLGLLELSVHQSRNSLREVEPKPRPVQEMSLSRPCLHCFSHFTAGSCVKQQVLWTANQYSTLASLCLGLEAKSLRLSLFIKHHAPLVMQKPAQHRVGTGSTGWPFSPFPNFLAPQPLQNVPVGAYCLSPFRNSTLVR